MLGKNDTPLNANNVQYLLKNTIYYGVIRFNGEIYEGSHPFNMTESELANQVSMSLAQLWLNDLKTGKIIDYLERYRSQEGYDLARTVDSLEKELKGGFVVRLGDQIFDSSLFLKPKLQK